MDIDKLFKRPNLPASALKKGNWTPEEAAAQAARAAASDARDVEDVEGPVAGPSVPRPPRASVAEDEDDDEYGPSMPEDFGDADEEDSRFFGGGLTDQQERILNILEQDEGEATSESAQLSDLRKQLLRLERAINRNQELRMKHPDEPKKFIESEADLDSEIRALVILTATPRLYYGEAVKNNVPSSLASLMSHENADIAAAVVTLVEELTDDDVLEGVEEEEREAAEKAMAAFVDALLGSQLLDLLLANLDRFLQLAQKSDEAQDADEQGIYHTFGALENLTGLKPEISRKLAQYTRFVGQLIQLINARATSAQVRGYAAELLAVLCQYASRDSDSATIRAFSKADAIDGLLKALSSFRKRDPVDAEETELMENLFDALCALLADDGHRRAFLDGEGVELLVLMTQSKVAARLKAVKALDHAMSGPSGSAACSRFVESLGLKSLFQLLMARGSESKRKAAHEMTAEDEEHVLSIMVSLLNALPRDSVERIRFLAKFAQKDYEKLDRLLELRERFRERLERSDSERGPTAAEAEEDEDTKALLHLERLEAGLFALQLCDYVLAWLCVEDDGMREHAQMLLARRGQKLAKDVVANLQAYYYDLGDEGDAAQESAAAQAAAGAKAANGHSAADAPRFNQREVIVDLVNQLLDTAS